MAMSCVIIFMPYRLFNMVHRIKLFGFTTSPSAIHQNLAIFSLFLRNRLWVTSFILEDYLETPCASQNSYICMEGWSQLTFN